MRKLVFLFAALMLLSSNSLCAEDDEYKSGVNTVVDEVRDLEPAMKQSVLDRVGFERWHKDFTPVFEKFQSSHINVYKLRRSFQMIRQASEGFSSAWAQLKQAEYSASQYNESITMNQVEYAHKWKRTEAEQLKGAYDVAVEAVNKMKEAKNLAERGE